MKKTFTDLSGAFNDGYRLKPLRIFGHSWRVWWRWINWSGGLTEEMRIW